MNEIEISNEGGMESNFINYFISYPSGCSEFGGLVSIAALI